MDPHADTGGMDQIEIEGLRIAYRRTGEGPLQLGHDPFRAVDVGADQVF